MEMTSTIPIFSDYGIARQARAGLPELRIGSSPFVHDRRSLDRTLPVRSDLANAYDLPVAEQVQEFFAMLSLTKAQFAQILRIDRAAVDEWLRGEQPNAANAKRLRILLRVFERASVSSMNRLNARFVRKPEVSGAPSLLDLLGEEQIDENRLIQVIKRVRMLGEEASRERARREERLRRLGFEEQSREQRKRQLATNVALMDWPNW